MSATCLLDQQARLHLTAGRLTVQRPERANTYLPLVQTGRVVIKGTSDPALQALLLLVEAGRSVHFLDGRGHPVATLTPHAPATAAQGWAEQLTLAIIHQRDDAFYNRWLENQLSHACSRCIPHTHAKDLPRVQAAQQRLLARAPLPCALDAVLDELGGQLWAWVGHRLENLGLGAAIEALTLRNCKLASDLERLLTLPLTTWITPLLRERPTLAYRVPQLFHGLEAQLDKRLRLHLQALHYNVQRPRPESTHPSSLRRYTPHA